MQLAGWIRAFPQFSIRKGASWSESPAVAYARARPRTKAVSTIEGAVHAAVDALRAQGNPDYNAKFLKAIKSDDGKEGMIYRFSGSKTGDIEATAYFPEKRTIDFVTLSCRSEKVFEASLSAFEQLAASYSFQADKIPVDPNKQGFFQEGAPKD